VNKRFAQATAWESHAFKTLTGTGDAPVRVASWGGDELLLTATGSGSGTRRGQKSKWVIWA
jgi:hypothetical protein